MAVIGLAQQEAFLEEYEALVRKHGLFIAACGCCNSPWLAKLEPGEDPDVRSLLQ